jgi:hypothetical protein
VTVRCPTQRVGAATGTFSRQALFLSRRAPAGPCLPEEVSMHGLIYLIGLIVVIMAILSFFGLR